jgi:hypothetical protein
MSNYSHCQDIFSIQLQELVRINQLHNNLETLYHTKIGTLYDEFQIEIPFRFEKEYDVLWSDDTKERVKEAAAVAAGILNEVRLKPKPYEPLSSQDVKEQLKVIEKAMLEDMTERFLECACPVFESME